MGLLQSFHTGLVGLVSGLKMLLEFISVLCVCLGLLTSLTLAGGFWRRSGRLLPNLASVRLQFGSWLALALEFQLGADIIATTINPTLQSLGELGLLAVIRTFLNYFLQKELAEQERVIREALESKVKGE